MFILRITSNFFLWHPLLRSRNKNTILSTLYWRKNSINIYSYAKSSAINKNFRLDDFRRETPKEGHAGAAVQQVGKDWAGRADISPILISWPHSKRLFSSTAKWTKRCATYLFFLVTESHISYRPYILHSLHLNRFQDTVSAPTRNNKPGEQDVGMLTF